MTLNELESKLNSISEIKIMINDGSMWLHGMYYPENNSISSFSVRLQEGLPFVDRPFHGPIRDRLINHLREF